MNPFFKNIDIFLTRKINFSDKKNVENGEWLTNISRENLQESELMNQDSE